MLAQTHAQLANFIWGICNLLRGPYKRSEYRKVILPLTVLRRFDCLLAPTKAQVLATHAEIKAKPESIVRSLLEKTTGRPFYNLSRLDFGRLLDDPNQLAPNLNSYINGFSPNVRAIMERFAFDQQIARMAEKNLLYEVVKAFAKIDLSPDRMDNVAMGYVFEELIRIGAEQSNEEAGEHFTPREVIKLMVNLLLSPEQDLRRSHVVKTIYDPACGTDGMLSVAEHYIRDLNREANPILYGQDWNDEAWAVCKSDMLIKGQDAENIRLGDSFAHDQFSRLSDGRKISFDYIKMKKSLGNKRNKIGDRDEGEPDQIGEITRIFGNFRDGETRTFTLDSKEKTLVVSKVLDNEDFGYRKITVERPLRLNFEASPERIAKLEEETAFKNLAGSNKKSADDRERDIALGQARQETIRALLHAFAEAHGAKRYSDRKAFLKDLRELDRAQGVRLGAAELKAVLSALGERDETAEVCLDKDGKPEPDAELRDTETLPLKERIEDYFAREVLPHVPDAWIDHAKTKVGYEIPLNRRFYRYEPPEPLELIEADIKTLEGEILALLKEVTA